MGDLDVTITPNLVEIEVNMYVEKTDVIKMLQFDPEEIEDLLKIQSSLQARWEAVAIEVEKNCTEFNEDFRRKWWAHTKQYARSILIAQGESKPTKEAIKDMVILIFSESTPKEARTYYAQLAYEIAVKKKTMYTGDLGADAFKVDMYKYLTNEPAWFFESVERTYRKLQTDHSHVKNVAEKLNNRAYNLNALKELTKQKVGNTPR